jgi:threonine/homoserine/homoserine lactone efflux protein
MAKLTARFTQFVDACQIRTSDFPHVAMTAFLLGLIGGSIPGPVLAATFTQILQKNFRSSLNVIAWSLFVEAAVALVSMWILEVIAPSSSVFLALSITGALVMLWIARKLWFVRRIDGGQALVFDRTTIALMILTNGVLWTFWLTVCAPQAITLGRDIPFGQYLFLLQFEFGWVLSTIAVAAVFACFRRWLSHPVVVPLLFKLFSLTFTYFALSLLWKQAS